MAFSPEIRQCLTFLDNGDAALRYLRGEGPFEGRPDPEFVILDLNLPGLDGRTVLREIKSDPDLKWIPVIVMTHSTHTKRVRSAYGDHANCFVSKPMELDRFRTAVRIIETFWTTTATLPQR